MILDITTMDFSRLDTRGKKKVFADFLGHKVNEIVWGGMTNEKWGEYRVRHEGCAYSNIRIDPHHGNKVHMTIYNFQTKQWEEMPC